MRVSIGSDHRGVAIRYIITRILDGMEIDVREYGPSKESEATDYPEVAWNVAADIQQNKADFGILICGTGIGVSVAANKVKGVRAALIHNVAEVKQCREHAACNVLCLGASIGCNVENLSNLVETFLTTKFTNEERHQRRVSLIEALEEKYFDKPVEMEKPIEKKTPKEIFEDDDDRSLMSVLKQLEAEEFNDD